MIACHSEDVSVFIPVPSKVNVSFGVQATTAGVGIWIFEKSRDCIPDGYKRAMIPIQTKQ